MNLTTLPINKEIRTSKNINQEGEPWIIDIHTSDANINVDIIQGNHIETELNTFLQKERQKVSLNQQPLHQRAQRKYGNNVNKGNDLKNSTYDSHFNYTKLPRQNKFDKTLELEAESKPNSESEPISTTVKLTHNVNADSQSNEGIPKEKSIPSDGFDMKHSMVYKNKLSQIEMLKKQQGYIDRTVVAKGCSHWGGNFHTYFQLADTLNG